MSATIGGALVLAVLLAAIGHASCSDSASTTSATDGGALDAPVADGVSFDDVANADAGGGSDAGPLADGALLSDPAIWSALPGSAPCQIYSASTQPDPFPRRVWQSCGNGCRGAPAGLPIATLAYSVRPLSGGAYVGGEGLVLVEMEFQSATVDHVFRLSDDATVAAVALRRIGPLCTFGSHVSDAPFVFTPLRDSPPSYRLGRAQPQPGAPIAWQSAWIVDPAISLYRFAFDEGIGFAEYDGAIRLLRTTDAGAFTVISQRNAQMAYVSGRGSLLVWSLWTTGGSDLMGYTRANGTMMLRSLQNSWTASVRLSDDRMVWIDVQGPNVLNGDYASAQIYWSPVPARPQDIVVTAGPNIPAQNRLSDLAVGGDYAATIGCPNAGTMADCRLFVVQFSTKRLWTLNHRPGPNVFADVMAVTPTEIVVGEDDDTPHGDHSFPRLLRLETAHLDDLAW